MDQSAAKQMSSRRLAPDSTSVARTAVHTENASKTEQLLEKGWRMFQLGTRPSPLAKLPLRGFGPVSAVLCPCVRARACAPVPVRARARAGPWVLARASACVRARPCLRAA